MHERDLCRSQGSRFHQRRVGCVLASLSLGLLTMGCGSSSSDTDDTSGSETEAGSATQSDTSTGSSTDTSSSASTSTGDGDGDGDGDSTGDGDGDGTGDGDGDGDSAGDGDGDGDACDYQVGTDGVLMFEAEDLPLIEDWVEANTVPDAYGTGYIYWAGSSFNNSPGNGLIEIELGVSDPGRYRVQWRNQIGMGTNATEHNDIWLRFTDVADYYGKAGANPETRRYPKPICDDTAAMAAVESMAEVSEARCANGSTSDGWMKVYSSGATSWRWSTRTSDNDAHDIFVEFDAPGAYTMQLSARADYLLLDRVVIHKEDVDDAVALDPAHATTPCN